MSSLLIHHKTLIAFYEEVHLIISNLEYSRGIKSIINDTTRWEGLIKEQRDAINQFIKIDPIPNRIIANALFLSVVAGFENFLRNLLAGILKQVEQKDEIPDSILKRNIQLSGVALSCLYSPPAHLKLDYPNITKKLATCYSKDTKTQLNEEITGFIKSILELDNVFEFLEDCEISITWDKFVKKGELKKMLNTENSRETGKQLKEQINSYIKNRNRIAHTGLSSSNVTINEVKEAMNYFLYIGEFLIDQCQTQLVK